MAGTACAGITRSSSSPWSTLLGLVALGVFSWLARKEWKRNFVALLGTVFLYVFVLIRASSIHHVDIWLQWRILGMKWNWNWNLELGGIVVVGLGALLACIDDRRSYARDKRR